MDANHLSRYFPTAVPDDPDTLEAQQRIRVASHDLALVMNRVLPDSQTKLEMLMRLMHLIRDVNMALELDGPSRTNNMVVLN